MFQHTLVVLNLQLLFEFSDISSRLLNFVHTQYDVHAPHNISVWYVMALLQAEFEFLEKGLLSA